MANKNPSNKFQPGNQAAAGAKHENRRPLTQMLISALNEPFHEWDKKAGRYKAQPSPAKITKMRKLIDNLIHNATVLNETSAITHIIDRVEGKPLQGLTGPEGEPLEPAVFVVRATPAQLKKASVDA